MNYVCADIHGRWDKYQAMLEDLNLGEDGRRRRGFVYELCLCGYSRKMG